MHRLENENKEQYIWRLCQAKDLGQLDMDWTQLANVLNRELFSDETEYMGEAAYRKPYQQAKKFYEAGVFEQSTNSYIEEIQEAQHELRKEKQRMFDERTALNRKLRNSARTENDLKYLEDLIAERGFNHLPPHEQVPQINSNNDLVICVSDFHLGASNYNQFGKYSSDIAGSRLWQYLAEIQQIQKIHNSENAYVLLLGDILNGNIHYTTQLENRENVVEQVQAAAELLAEFVYELSSSFSNVYVNSVAGNHTRLSMKKDNVLRGERLDNLIPWYMKAVLRNVENVRFIDEDNYDATIGKVDIRGNEYLLVHGDFDSFNKNGVSKLVMMIGKKPTGIFYGHLHTCSYDDISDVKIIRSGAFSGTGDDYCISKRIYGKPSQMVTVVDSAGVVCCYPIELDYAAE